MPTGVVFAAVLLAPAVLAACVGATSPATGPTEAEVEALVAAAEAAARETVEAALADQNVPGAVVGFVLPGGHAGTVAVGSRDLEGLEPLQPGDRMLVGSTGKTFVSAVALQLVAEGHIGLDDTLEAWFGGDEWLGRVPNGSTATVRQLLGHTSGIPRYVFRPEFLEQLAGDPMRAWAPEELIGLVLGLEPRHLAGEGFSYADTNYLLVGLIIERATGRSYYDVLAERVLDPLALVGTIPSNRRDLEEIVPGYLGEDIVFGLPTVSVRDGLMTYNPQFEWTGGGLASTAGDLARWAFALYGGGVVPDSVRGSFLEPFIFDPDGGVGYGLGVFVRPLESGVAYGHPGVMPGYETEMQYYSAHDLAVAVQVNAGFTSGRLQRPLRDIVDDVTDVLARVSAEGLESSQER